ncbi:hypothetical protein ACFFNY_22715 [Paenibacillus hodogayensis]|uniref:Uncharacterized protein n=1 Tax=Paenibacillus hodogayensis TaxID=279208 RepID=A0ABV5W1K9_9BACL
MRKDAMFRGISLLVLLASATLVIMMGSRGGYDLQNPLQPLRMIAPLSLLFYFIMPIHACFFSTEGFEYGTLKTRIASGQSRASYVWGKFAMMTFAVIGWLAQFYILYEGLYLIMSGVTGASIGGVGWRKEAVAFLTIAGFNALYLTAYGTVMMMTGFLIRKTAAAASSPSCSYLAT